jgi:hypothetical protein
MKLMASAQGKEPRRSCAPGLQCVGGVECLATPRRELDSHSLNRATYTVAWKFRRSDKLAQQVKESPAGEHAVRALRPSGRRTISNDCTSR